MKIFASIMGSVLGMTLGFSAVASEQDSFGFGNSSPAISSPGPGDPDFEYHFRVPQGVTVTTKDGKQFTGGQMLAIPGEYLRLMASKDTAGKFQDPTGFTNKKDVDVIKPADRKNWAVVELTIPEGVTVSRDDGRTVQGPAKVDMLVLAESLFAKKESDLDEMRGFGDETSIAEPTKDAVESATGEKVRD
jgi:hypothetical protein